MLWNLRVGTSACALVLCSFLASSALAQGQPGRNTDIGGRTPHANGVKDVGLRQQNEPSCAIKPSNPLHIMCGFNDYRGVDHPLIGDAWEGYATSINGGDTWISNLIPGHGADSPSLGLAFAADPNLSALPGLLLFNYIAADREDTGEGGLFLQYFFEQSKEDAQPWVPAMAPITIATGTSGKFLDKPSMLTHLLEPGSTPVTVSATLKDGSLVSQDVPAGDVYVAYSVFTGNDNNDGTKILLDRSSDYGQSWTTTKLSESVHINQSTSLAALGDQVCAVWRRFADNNEAHTIMFSCSSNRGRKWSKGKAIANLCPFDQGTSSVSFRTNAFPTITTDGERFYAFWTTRGGAGANPNCESGLARIVYATSIDGRTWTSPQDVDNDTGVGGHQFMPQATSARGTIQLAWYDTRYDASGVNSPFLNDFTTTDGTAVIRRSGDVRTTQIRNGIIAASTQVSRYRTGVPAGSDQPIQLERNFLNDRMFKQGSVPFVGDYTNVSAPEFRLEDMAWVDNAIASDEPDNFHVTWSDNRDVRGNVWGNLDAPTVYTPPIPATVNNQPAKQTDEQIRFARAQERLAINEALAASEGDSTQNYMACNPTTSTERTRNQNVYSAVIRPGLALHTASAPKPTGLIQRAFAIQISNHGEITKTFSLAIANQPDDAPFTGRASFLQLPLAPYALNDPDPLTMIDVEIPANSSATRTVYVSSIIPRPPIKLVTSDALSGLSDTVLINGDAFAPEVSNPDFVNPDLANSDILSVEIHNPDLVNKVVTSIANPDLANPDLANPDLANPDLANPDLANPDLVNQDYANPDLANPDLANPDLANVSYIYAELENPDLANATITEADLDAGATDITWTVRNDGNTTTSYNVDTFVSGPTTGLKTQFFATRTYVRATARECVLREQAQNQVIFNRLEPDLGLAIIDPLDTSFGDGTFYAAPGEFVQVTLRIWGDADFNANRVGLRINSQACNTGEELGCIQPFAQDGVIDVTGPVFGDIPIGISGVEAEGPSGAVVEFVATATDEVDGDIPVMCVPASGSTFPLGNTTTGCVAEDASGNSSTASFNVEVVDSVKPTLTLPSGGITVDATGSGGATVDFAALIRASDIVDPSVDISCTPASGDQFPIGTTSVSCTATDDFGNSAMSTFLVNVLDSVPPIIVVPGATVVAQASGPAGATVLYEVSASDNIDGDLTPSCSPVSGSTFALGTTTVNCSVTDTAANTTNAEFLVSVIDTLPPELVLPGDIFEQIQNSAGAVVNYEASASDAVDTDVSVVCTPPSGSTFIGETQVECTATDDSGNSASASFTIAVQYAGFLGLQNPYEPPPKTFNLGSSTPLIWQYTDPAGNIVDSAIAAPRIEINGPFRCNLDDGGPIVVNDPGSSYLRYSPGGSEWRFNWQADGAGVTKGCYNIRVYSQLTGQVSPTFKISMR